MGDTAIEKRTPDGIAELRKDLRDDVHALVESYAQRLEDAAAQLEKLRKEPLEDWRVVVDHIRAGLFIERIKNGDNETLAALSRFCDLARHAVGEQLGGKPFVDMVPAVLELAGAAEALSTKGREPSIEFKTEGGSVARLTLVDAKKLLRVAIHYGRIGVIASAHSATITAGALWVLRHLAAAFGFPVG